MTTRGRIARGEHQQEFEGHVQRWVKQWEQVGGTSKMKTLKWVPTGDRSESKADSRFPHLKPVRDSSLKVVFRPKQQPPSGAQQPPKTIDGNPGNGATVTEAMQLDEKAPAPLAQADVPMSEAPAAAEEAQQGIGPEQQSSHAASGEVHGSATQKQQQERSADVQKQGGQATDAQNSDDRAVAEQAAQERLAALNADSSVKQATHSAQAAAPTPGSTAVSRDAQANAAAGSAIAERAVVQQEHVPAGASAGAAPEVAKPSGRAAAMEAIEATAEQLGGPVNTTDDEAMPNAEAQP